MVEGESPHQKTFESLSPLDKVKAVLTQTDAPVTPSLLYEFASLDPKKLTDQDRQEITTFLQDPQVIKTRDNKYGEQLSLKPEDSQTIIAQIGINPDLVYDHINEVLTEDISSL